MRLSGKLKTIWKRRTWQLIHKRKPCLSRQPINLNSLCFFPVPFFFQTPIGCCFVRAIQRPSIVSIINQQQQLQLQQQQAQLNNSNLTASTEAGLSFPTVGSRFEESSTALPNNVGSLSPDKHNSASPDTASKTEGKAKKKKKGAKKDSKKEISADSIGSPPFEKPTIAQVNPSFFFWFWSNQIRTKYKIFFFQVDEKFYWLQVC